MGDSKDTIGPALTVAGRWLRNQPKMLLPEHEHLRREFARTPEVQRYLRTVKRQPRIDGTAVTDLLQRSEAWLSGGERWAIASLYEHTVASPAWAEFGRREGQLYQTICALACIGGARVLASMRYLAIVLEHEYGDRADAKCVSRSLVRLHRGRLADVTPGKRNAGGRRSTVIDLRPWLTPTPEEPSTATLLDLTLTFDTLDALSEYRRRSRADR